MTTPLFPSVIAWNLLDGGTDAQDGNNYPGPLLQNHAAAVVGSVGGLYRPQLSSGIVRRGREMAIVTGKTTALTFAQALRLPCNIKGFSIGFEGAGPTAMTISAGRAAILGTAGQTATQAMDAMTNFPASTPTSITWAGAAGLTVPARTATDRPSRLQKSDPCFISGAATQTLAIEVLIDYPGSTWDYAYAPLSLNAAQQVAATNYPYCGWQFDGDKITGNPAWGINTSNGNSNLLAPFLELYTDTTVITVASVTDSTGLGTTDAGTNSISPVQIACEALSTSSVTLLHSTRGWSGKTAQQLYLYLMTLLEDAPPNILIWQLWSQNNTTDTEYSREISLARDVVMRCRLKGVVPVILTGIPTNSLSLANDTQRKLINDTVRDWNEIVCDADALISDGASPARYLSAYGTGTHPNTAGYNALAAGPYATAIRQAVAVLGYSV